VVDGTSHSAPLPFWWYNTNRLRGKPILAVNGQPAGHSGPLHRVLEATGRSLLAWHPDCDAKTGRPAAALMTSALVGPPGRPEHPGREKTAMAVGWPELRKAARCIAVHTPNMALHSVAREARGQPPDQPITAPVWRAHCCGNARATRITLHRVTCRQTRVEGQNAIDAPGPGAGAGVQGPAAMPASVAQPNAVAAISLAEAGPSSPAEPGP